MTDPKEPYSIDPGEAGAPVPKVPGAPGAPESKPRLFDIPLPSPEQPKGKIQAPELLADFDKDADFNRDPELDRVILGKPVKEAPASPEATARPAEDFVQPGLGGAKVWAIIGGALLIIAMIATAMQPGAGGMQRLLRLLLVAYNTLLHTGTGVVALFVAATLLGKRLGNFELAAARMLAAVGAFAVMLSLRLSLFGLPWLDDIVVLLFASAAYVLLVATTFNLWKKHPLAYVVGSHFFLWLIVAVGMLLAQAVKPLQASSPTPAKAPEVKAPEPKSGTSPGSPSPAKPGPS